MSVMPERLKPIFDETRDIADLFEAAGARLYLVGGVVRDALLGRLSPTSDLDFTTDVPPSRTEEILAPWADSIWLQG